MRKLAFGSVCFLLMVSLLAGNGYAGNVGTIDILDGAVTTPKIADVAVTTPKIADGAVTDAKISGLISAEKISFLGLNAEKLDGYRASDFSLKDHQHLAIQASNVIIVAKSGGNFTTIADAMNSITDSGPDNAYIIKIMPGIYDITTTIYLKNYVFIEGSGVDSTILRDNANQYSISSYLPGVVSGISGITIENLTQSSYNISLNRMLSISLKDIIIKAPNCDVSSVPLSIFNTDKAKIDNVRISGNICSYLLYLHSNTQSSAEINGLNLDSEAHNAIMISGDIDSRITNSFIHAENGIGLRVKFDMSDPFRSPSIIISDSILTGDSSSIYSEGYSAYNTYPAINVRNSELIGQINAIESKIKIANSLVDGNAYEEGSGFVKMVNCYDSNYVLK